MPSRKPTSYNIHEAKTHLSQLLERVAHGEEIVIAKAGQPIARLVPILSSSTDRTLGTETGRFVVPEDFNASLPPDLLDEFES